MIRLHRFAAGIAITANCIFSASLLFAEVPAEFQPNYDQGYNSGYSLGYESGFQSGSDRGTTEGTSKGQSDGYDAGWNNAYQPAYDNAYALNLPFGHFDGWNEGVLAGFEEGFNWAPTIANAILSHNPNYFGGSNSGFVTVSARFSIFDPLGGTPIDGASHGTLTVHNFVQYDWAAHYYGVGYDDGRANGLSAGDTDGYQSAYQPAYDAAFRIGFGDGSEGGANQGRTDGASAGFDAGWDLGYGTGFDQGFYAGVDYHLFGEFIAPEYGFPFGTIQVPEPASFTLIAIAAALVSLRRTSRN